LASSEKVIITGASGFIGARISDYLEDMGFDVTRISRRPGPGIHAVEDYRDTPAGKYLIHLAESPVISEVNEKDPDDKGEMLLDDLAGRFEQLIYASSAAVYGNTNPHPNKVDDPVDPSDAYTRQKISNEKTAMMHGGIVLRLSNIFGPGMSETTVFSDIMKQIDSTGPLLLRDLSPVRDFLSIYELSGLFARLLDEFRSCICNVGSGSGISIGDLARLILDTCGQEGRSVEATNASSNRSCNTLDISETYNLFRWKPSLPLEEQVRQFIHSEAYIR